MLRNYAVLFSLIFATPGCSDVAGNGTSDFGTATEAVVYNGVTFDDTLVPDAGSEACQVPQTEFDKLKKDATLLIRRGDAGVLRGLCTVYKNASPDANYPAHHMTLEGYNDRVADNSNPASQINVGTRNSDPNDKYVASIASSLVDGATNSANQVKEYWSKSASNFVLYTAPHPFESNTYHQIETIQNLNHQWNSFWAVAINNNEDSASKYHITATKLRAESWEGLSHFVGLFQDYPAFNQSSNTTNANYAVSFHGMGKNTCDKFDDNHVKLLDRKIMIGGRIAASFRRGVGERILEYIPPLQDKERIIWKESLCTEKDGLDWKNFVNLAALGNRGLQLEQEGDWAKSNGRDESIAKAVESVYECLAQSSYAGASTIDPNTPLSAGSSGAWYADSARNPCARWVAEFEPAGDHNQFAIRLEPFINASGQMDYSGCMAGAKAFVDYYRLIDDATGRWWKRIGGGRIDFTAGTYPACVQKHVLDGDGTWTQANAAMQETDPNSNPTVDGVTNFDPSINSADASKGFFRIVVKAVDPQGAPLGVMAGVGTVTPLNW